MDEILKFCSRKNIPIAWNLTQTIPMNGQYFPWNGRGMCLTWQSLADPIPRSFSTKDMWHDIAHWLIAEPSQRSLPNMCAGEKEELLASKLGILLHKYIGNGSDREINRGIIPSLF